MGLVCITLLGAVSALTFVQGQGPFDISSQEFSDAITTNGYPAPRDDQYQNFINKANSVGSISSKDEAAMILAHVIHETGGLQKLEEDGCAGNNCPQYAQPDCDAPGQQYYGRGYLQLTWCTWNYQPASNDLYGDGSVLVNNPGQVSSDEGTAWDTAFWFWKTNVHNKGLGQDGRFGATTRAINGPIECDGGNQAAAQQRFQIYSAIRQVFNLQGDADPSGCYN